MQVDDLQSTIEDEIKFSPEDFKSLPEDLKATIVEKVSAEQERSTMEMNGSLEPMQIEKA